MVWKKKVRISKKVRVVKLKKPKAIKPPKIFNGGTMTNSAFFGMLRATFRKASRWWIPVKQCKELAKRKSQSSNKRLKWEYKCADCGNYFPEKGISVDHIIPA